MPRVKSSHPTHLDRDHRWGSLLSSSADAPQGCSNISPEDSENGERVYYNGKDGAAAPRRSKRQRKKRAEPLIDLNVLTVLKECDFYLTLRNVVEKRNGRLMGTVPLYLKGEELSEFLLRQPEYWLYVHEIPSESVLYFEWKTEDNKTEVRTFRLKRLPPYSVLEGLQIKASFELRVGQYDTGDQCLHVDVVLHETRLIKPKNTSDPPALKSNVGFQAVMKYLFDTGSKDYSHSPYSQKHDIDALYAAVKARRDETNSAEDDFQHPGLVPVLRTYQTSAVRWMLKRERNLSGYNETIHDLFEPVTLPDGDTLFYNKYGGYLVDEKPLKTPDRPGGILADEMGLGKTVEVLALILWNPREVPTGDVRSINSEEHDLCNGENATITNGTDFQNDDEPLSTKRKHANEEEIIESKRFHGESPYLTDDEHSNELETIERCEESPLYDGERDLEDKETKKKLNPVIESGRKYSSKAVAPKAFFECVCGSTHSGRKPTVQCSSCSLWQHSGCVNYKPSMGRFYCPHCWVAKPPVPSGATLIVSPLAIQNQWIEEIKRHLKREALKIYVYNGVHKDGFVQPPALASYDMVLVSYETLCKEVHYVDLPHSNNEDGRKLRHPKRFMAIPSPLVAVEWWRVCLDEAQMVECTTRKTAEMALRLAAVNRWCVTGTPIQKGLGDLYGLMLFLGVSPYYEKIWWHECLYEPYCFGDTEPMHSVISKFLWRTIKADVVDEIDIPCQTEKTHWLSFTPVEEHFYKQQHMSCSRDAMTRFKKFDNLNVKLSSLDRDTLNKVLLPLLRLRQACCHPQAVRGSFIPLHKTAITMEDLLDSLVKKTIVEAEEAHRAHIASLNGLAGIHVIKEEWVEAAELYREVLRLADKYTGEIKTDKPQRLHALHNLAELLSSSHSTIPPTLRDDQLKNEADELRNNYLTKYHVKVATSQETLVSVTKALEEIRSQFAPGSSWWVNLIKALDELGYGEDLASKVDWELNAKDATDTSRFRKPSKLVGTFRNAHGLAYSINTLLEELHKSHLYLSKCINKLKLKPTESELNAAVECHLRRTEENPPRCFYCEVLEVLNDYEIKIFRFFDDKNTGIVGGHASKDDAMALGLRSVTWADSDVEIMLKTLLGYAKSHLGSRSEMHYGATHVKLLEAMKKEFKAMRNVYMSVRDQVSAIDELNMATIRLRVRLPYEPKPDIFQPHILEPVEVDHQRMTLLSDRIVSINTTAKKMGQLAYLQNLAKSDYSKRGGLNPDPCPICQQKLGAEWSVLQCGHCFCVECTHQLMTLYSSPCRRVKTLKCAICRQTTTHGEISFVNTELSLAEESKITEVKGSHSTKVEGIVRILLQIQRDDSSAKALVFSVWQDVLDILAKAFDQNDIQYRNLGLHSKFQENLKTFKTEEDIKVLLLPVHSGANGLNIIEATHVLFVEPILNPASELQAIGRVHRIGQTKPTVVHRFLVKGTVEEKMHSMLKGHSPNTAMTSATCMNDENSFTIKELSDLFADENE